MEVEDPDGVYGFRRKAGVAYQAVSGFCMVLLKASLFEDSIKKKVFTSLYFANQPVRVGFMDF